MSAADWLPLVWPGSWVKFPSCYGLVLTAWQPQKRSHPQEVNLDYRNHLLLAGVTAIDMGSAGSWPKGKSEK
jgi:hypothetical protein